MILRAVQANEPLAIGSPDVRCASVLTTEARFMIWGKPPCRRTTKHSEMVT